MAAVIAVLAALHGRGATGRGDFCDISMMDGAMSWLSIHAGEFVATRKPPERERMHLSGAYPCYRVYPAADGWISVGALEPQFWTSVCERLERPDLLSDAFAVGDRRDEVVADLEKLFSTRPRAEWLEVFEGHDACVGPVNDFAEAFADEQARHRGMVVDTEIPGVGPWTYIGNPIRLADSGSDVHRLPPPRLGEHTEEILGAAGFTEQEIGNLRTAGAI